MRMLGVPILATFGMSTFGRRGHWRTNANGTTTWVSEHSVSRDTYTTSQVDGVDYVNGHRLLETICKYCYQKVFYAAFKNNETKFFNKRDNEISLHNCRKATTINPEVSPTRKAKKFLNENDMLALDRRARELVEKKSSASESSKFVYPGDVRKITLIFNALSKNELGLNKLKRMLKREDGYDTLVYIVRNHNSILINQRKHIASYNKKQFQKKIRDYQNLYLNVQKIVSATHSQEINSIFDVETLSLEAKKLAQSLQTLQELKIKRAKQEVKISLKVPEKNRSDKKSKLSDKELARREKAKIESEQRKRASAAALNVSIEIKKKKTIKR